MLGSVSATAVPQIQYGTRYVPTYRGHLFFVYGVRMYVGIDLALLSVVVGVKTVKALIFLDIPIHVVCWGGPPQEPEVKISNMNII